MPIGEICNREVVIIDSKASISDAAKLMRQYHVGDVVVVEEQAGKRVPVGILTDRDIVLEIVAEAVNPEKITVRDAMAYDLSSVHERDGVWETLEFMRSKGVRRMPVLDAGGGLAGIISTDDLLELLATELNSLTGVIKREQFKEAQARK